MAVSKQTVINALGTFKGLQDTFNEDKFVEQENGKALISATDQTKLDGIETGAEVNAVETVKVDGVALTPDADKAVNVDLSGKVDKVEGKQLSTNDFTDDYKATLDGITDETITEAEIQALFA